MTTESPVRWLRGEGLAALAVSAALYASLGGSWLLFALLFLAPDLSMLGYLRDRRIGAAAYNLGHTYAVPLTLVAAGVLLGEAALVRLPLIWTAHIGFDRALGYGLKLPSGFQDTHLGPIVTGRRARSQAEAARRG